MKLNELFDIKNGLSSAFVTISDSKTDEYSIPYIRPSNTYDNLVAGYVSKSQVGDIHTFPQDTLFVSSDGEGSHSYAYVSPVKFVPNSNVSVLIPKIEMDLREKIFYAMVITKNRYRFNYGRKPKGERFASISVPPKEAIPEWVYKHNLDKTNPGKPLETLTIPLKTTPWGWFTIESLFDIKKGKRLTKICMSNGKTPFIGSINSNNGYREYIGQSPNHLGNTITINYNGSVGEAFYQPKPFWASDDVNVLYPKFKLNKYTAFFLITIIRKEKFRFNFGRKWEVERMKKSLIKLPITDNGEPDWQFMEDYIKSLPYSSNL